MNKKKLKKIALTSLGILLFLSIIALGSSGKSTKKNSNTSGKQSSAKPIAVAESEEEVYLPEIDTSQTATPPSSAPQQVYAPADIQVTDYFSAADDVPSASGLMEVHFIDVGQGDATLIICDGEAMLIDAGDNSKGTTVQYYLQRHGADFLKYLVLTHPDADHIGGADVIVTKFDIGTVFESYYKKPAGHKSSEELANALSYRHMTPVVPSVGSSYSLGGASFSFIGPSGYSDDPNNASLALILQYGNTRFLFTGDAESEEESAILNSGYDIKANVYKVGHHGSKTSSNDFFLRAIQPDYAVISCGVNDYGHPNDETLQRLYEVGASIFRTDQSGSIVSYTDGTSISWNTDQGGSSNSSFEPNKTTAPVETPVPSSEKKWYYVVTTAGYFHQSPCEGIRNGENPQTHYWYEGTREELIASGLTPCQYCNP